MIRTEFAPDVIEFSAWLTMALQCYFPAIV